MRCSPPPTYRNAPGAKAAGARETPFSYAAAANSGVHGHALRVAGNAAWDAQILGPPNCDKKGGVVRAGEDKKGKGYKCRFTPPPRSQRKRDAKIDGSQTGAKRSTNRGAKKQREKWGRGPPRNPRFKEPVARVWVTTGDSSAKQRPPRQRGSAAGWGADAQLGGQPGRGDPGPRLRSSAVRAGGRRAQAL